MVLVFKNYNLTSLEVLQKLKAKDFREFQRSREKNCFESNTYKWNNENFVSQALRQV